MKLETLLKYQLKDENEIFKKAFIVNGILQNIHVLYHEKNLIQTDQEIANKPKNVQSGLKTLIRFQSIYLY